MSEPSTAERRAEIAVGPDDQIVPFKHRLGGDVLVTAHDAAGQRVGYIMANPITADEVEVIVVPGTVARLVAVPAPPEGEGAPA